MFFLMGISAAFTGFFTSYMTDYWFNTGYLVQPFWYELILAGVIFDVILIGLAMLYGKLPFTRPNTTLWGY